MARIPEKQIEELKQSVSIVRLVESRGIELRKHRVRDFSFWMAECISEEGSLHSENYDGVVVCGGVVFTPGRIESTGPVDVGGSAMSGLGPGGSRIKPEESKASVETRRSGANSVRGASPVSTPTTANTLGNTSTRRAFEQSMARITSNLSRTTSIHRQG